VIINGLQSFVLAGPAGLADGASRSVVQGVRDDTKDICTFEKNIFHEEGKKSQMDFGRVHLRQNLLMVDHFWIRQRREWGQ
jgi:hypothetical protein